MFTHVMGFSRKREHSSIYLFVGNSVSHLKPLIESYEGGKVNRRGVNSHVCTYYFELLSTVNSRHFTACGEGKLQNMKKIAEDATCWLHMKIKYIDVQYFKMLSFYWFHWRDFFSIP